MKLSIITINKNNAAGLEKTISSVINQTCSGFEFIVIDGASTDDSVEIIKRYSDRINFWVSEPDIGIYNAMNKGIRKSNGEFCLFLNSGDFLVSPDTLINIFDEICNLPPSDIYYSDILDSDGKIREFPKLLNSRFLIMNALNHQNTLIKRDLFHKHGFYNENLVLVSDREFFLKEMWKYKSIFTYLKTNISIFDLSGVGSQETPLRRMEIKIFLYNIFGELYEDIIEPNKYRGTRYDVIVTDYGNSILLILLLKLYYIFIKIVFAFCKNVKSLFCSFFKPVCIILIYIGEWVSSVSDKKIRVSFTNFNDIPYNFFIAPLKIALEGNNLSCKTVKYYKPHIKIFFTGENVNISKRVQYKGNCVDSVDFSMGFDYLNANKYLRIPSWLLYYFTPFNTKEEIVEILASFKKNYEKEKFCSLIASHDNNGIRTKMYTDISRIGHIDCPGKFLHNDNKLYSIYDNNKARYLQQYKFNICPENSLSHGYVTEKLFQSIGSGCIPIYSGWSKDPEPDIVNRNIILWYDASESGNNENMVNDIKKLNSSEKMYASFVNQPFFCDTAVDKIYDMLQQYVFKMQSLADKVLVNMKY